MAARNLDSDQNWHGNLSMYSSYDINVCSKMAEDETIEIAYIVIERCFSLSIVMLYE